MLVLVAGDDATDLPGTPAMHEAIRRHAAGTTLDTVLVGLDVLTATKAKLRGSPLAQVLLEVAVVRLARLDEMLLVTQLAQAVANGQFAALPSAPNPGSQAGVAELSKKNSVPPANRVKVAAGPIPPGSYTADFGGVWEQVLQELGQIQRTQLQIVGIPAILGPNSLLLSFPADYSGAYDACASDAGQESLRRALRKASGTDWLVRVELKSAPIGTNATTEQARSTRERPKDLLQLPMFKRAVEVLGAQLVKVDDGFDPAPAASTAATSLQNDVPEPDEV
jgi:DNA polymerase-3 subunit gamma/tau